MQKLMPRIVESTPAATLCRSGRRHTRTVLSLLAGVVLGTRLVAQDALLLPAQSSFPDTEALVSRVAEHQKQVEALLTQYTFTDKTTLYTLDKTGSVRSQHTDTYYITPTPYEVFTLHISHDGKSISQEHLERQEKDIERKLANYERKAQKNPGARPKDALLFADIILKSQFNPLRWEDVGGTPMMVYSFAPKAQPTRHGSSDEKIAGDMKGTMWINPEAAEIVRMEFTSVSSLGLSLLVNVKSFQDSSNSEKWAERCGCLAIRISSPRAARSSKVFLFVRSASSPIISKPQPMYYSRSTPRMQWQAMALKSNSR